MEIRNLMTEAGVLRRALALAAIGLAGAGLTLSTGCDNEGPAEEAGEAIDEAAEDVGDAVEDATD
jgi:hypothetical protein